MTNCNCKNEGRQDELKNRASIEVGCGDNRRTIFSNEVEAKKVKLKIRKFEDKNCVFPGDIITYTIKIDNECDIDLQNAFFVDDLTRDLDYVNGSFIVNGDCKNPDVRGDKISYRFEELKKYSENIICFKARVL